MTHDPNVVRMYRYKQLLELFPTNELTTEFASVLWFAAGDDGLFASFLEEDNRKHVSANLQFRKIEFSAN